MPSRNSVRFGGVDIGASAHAVAKRSRTRIAAAVQPCRACDDLLRAARSVTARIAAAAWTRLEIDANSASLLPESALVRQLGHLDRARRSHSLLKPLRCDHSSGCGLEVSLEAEHWQVDDFILLAASKTLEISAGRHSPFFRRPLQPLPCSLARRCTEGAQTRSLQARENARLLDKARGDIAFPSNPCARCVAVAYLTA